MIVMMFRNGVAVAAMLLSIGLLATMTAAEISNKEQPDNNNNNNGHPYHQRRTSWYGPPVPNNGYYSAQPYYPSEPQYYSPYPGKTVTYPANPYGAYYYPSQSSYGEKDPNASEESFNAAAAAKTATTTTCTADSACSYGEYCASGICRSHGTCSIDDDCYNIANFLGEGIRGLAYRRCVTGNVCGVSECVPVANCPASPCEMLYKICSEEFVSCVDDFCDGCGARFFNARGERVCESVTADKTVINTYIQSHPNKPYYYPSKPAYGPYYPYPYPPSYGQPVEYFPSSGSAHPFGSPYHRRTGAYYPPDVYTSSYGGYVTEYRPPPYYSSEPFYGYASEHSYNSAYPNYSSKPTYDNDPTTPYQEPVPTGTTVTTSCESDSACAKGEYCAAGGCRMHGTCSVDEDCYNLANVLGAGIRGLAYRRCVTGNVCGVSECVVESSCPAAPCEMLYKACGEEFVSCVDDYCDGCGARFFNKKGERVCEALTADDALINNYLKLNPYYYPTAPENGGNYYPPKPYYPYPSYGSSYGAPVEYNPAYHNNAPPGYGYGSPYHRRTAADGETVNADNTHIPEHWKFYPNKPQHYPSFGSAHLPYPSYGVQPYHLDGPSFIYKFSSDQDTPGFGEPSASVETKTCESEDACNSDEYCAGGVCRSHGTCHVDEDCYNQHNSYDSGERGKTIRVCANGMCKSSACDDMAHCSARPCQYATCDGDFHHCVDDYCGFCGAKFFNVQGRMICDYKHSV